MLYKIFSPVVKRIRSMLDSLENFMKDWAGEEARPGHPAVPGVMERLQKIEGELKHNGGSSMKDAVKRIEKKLDEIDTRLDEGNARFNELESKVK